MRTTVFAVAVVALAGCGRYDATRPELTVLPLFDVGGVPANGIPFTAVGDCTGLNVLDPGTVEVKNGMRFERGLVAECVTTGSLAGIIRFTRSSTLRNADGPASGWEGPVWGTTTIMVERYFGQAGFVGTFTGPYRTDWQNLLSGETRLNRRGTGDFRGLTTVGVARSSGLIIDESGFIYGPQG